MSLGVMAKHLRVRASWLRAQAEAERVPHIKADDQILFDPEAVEDILLHRAQRRPRRPAPAFNGKVDLFSVRQLADFLDVSESWVRRQAREGWLPCFKCGRRYYFSINAVIDELRARAAEVLL